MSITFVAGIYLATLTKVITLTKDVIPPLCDRGVDLIASVAAVPCVNG